MRQSIILNRAPRFHGMESGVQHCLQRREEEMGRAKNPLGTILGLLFWITIQGATRNFCTKLPCFSHRREITRLNSMVVKLFWQCDLTINEMLKSLNESSCYTLMVTDQYPKITRMFTILKDTGSSSFSLLPIRC